MFTTEKHEAVNDETSHLLSIPTPLKNRPNTDKILKSMRIYKLSYMSYEY